VAQFQVIHNEVPGPPQRPRTRRVWPWVLTASIAALLIVLIGIASVVPLSSDILKRKLRNFPVASLSIRISNA